MSTIIKAANSPRHVQRIAFSFEDLRGRAGEYLEQVQLQATQIVSEAREQAESIRRRAEEEGRASALRAAEQALDERIGKQMESLLPALRQAVSEIHDARQAWLNHWEQSAVRLAATMALKIVRRNVDLMPEVALGLVREALEMAAGSAQVRILLNPADREALGGQVVRLAGELSPAAPLEVEADERVSRGGCLVETRHGAIDQRLESQLERIVEELSPRSGPCAT